MIKIFLIAMGGAIGSLLRYFNQELVDNIIRKGGIFLPKLFSISFDNFPFSTILINIIGSFVMGIFYFLSVKYFSQINFFIKNFLMIGLIGGYTTFSTFSLDFFRLYLAGQYLLAMSYVMISVFFSLLALFAGFYLTKLIIS
jgi:CrcB protein